MKVYDYERHQLISLESFLYCLVTGCFIKEISFIKETFSEQKEMQNLVEPVAIWILLLQAGLVETLVVWW